MLELGTVFITLDENQNVVHTPEAKFDDDNDSVTTFGTLGSHALSG